MAAKQVETKADLSIASLFGVKGKTVVVTGGGRGIGRYIAEGYVRNGAKVFICSRDTKALTSTAAELNAIGNGGTCVAIEANLETVAACDAFAARLKTEFGVAKLHVLINNSGVSWGEPLEKYSEKGWDKVMNINLKSVFYLTRALLPLLRAAASPADPARIINIGSIVGFKPQLVPTYAYDLSKAGLHHLTKKLADEFSSEHITVNAIAPGFVPTKMSKGLEVYGATKEVISQGVPLGRMGDDADMAGAALYYGSRASAWVTGTVLPVDGGQLISLRSML